MNFPAKPKRKAVDSASQGSSKGEVSNSLFVETVKENYQMYIRKCYAYVKCISTAEDAVQEGVLAAHLNLASLENRDALGAWLYRIVIRKAIDMLYKNQKVPQSEEDLEELLSYDKNGFLNAPMWSGRSNPEEQILKSEGLAQVSKAVDSLADVYRIPILLKDFEGFSIREVSDMLQISESNAKVRIHRARIKLKNELNDYFYPQSMRDSK